MKGILFPFKRFFLTLLLVFFVNSPIFSQDFESSVHPKEQDFIKMDAEFFYTRAWILSSAKTRSTIILIGIVHVAEPKYFREVDDLLQRCEKIFYEGIHPKLADPQARSKNKEKPGFQLPLLLNAKVELSLDQIRQEQLEFAEELDLAFQFHILNPKENWILADTNTEDFAKSIQDLSPEELSLDKNSLEENANDIRQMGPDSDQANPNKYFVRRKIAEEITTSSRKINSNPKYAKVLDALIKRRNNIVLKKVTNYLDTSQTLGILYGAAHMPDFLNRLETEWGYKVVEARWIPAWSLTKEE